MTYDANIQARDLLAELFGRYHSLLVCCLIRKTRCRQRAEDLAQSVWLKLLSALGRGLCETRSDPELRAYVFEVAHNAWLDEYTRKHGEARTRTFDPSDLERMTADEVVANDPEQSLQRSQVASLLNTAFCELPPEQRQVIRMWSTGISIREMSHVSAAPTDTVLSRKKYALARLRVSLSGMAI